MSFILNALRKAENKSFASDRVKIKKQVLVLRQRTRRKNLKILSLITVLLVTLFGGWLLGQMRNPLQDNPAGLTASQPVSNDKKVVPASKESFLEKNELVDHSNRAGEMLLNDHLRGSDDKRNQETETKAVNPPIPVRVAAVPMEENILKETPVAPKQAETKSVVEESLQNYLDLPFLMKQQMPQLKISLHYYSSNPARRIVRINGNILHENDSIEDGLTVEEIKPTTAVLLYDGVLFELNAPGG